MAEPAFRLTDAAFAALGAGRPEPATLDLLGRAELTRHLLLLREIRRALPTDPPWFAALARDRRRIADPMTGLWAAHTLAALRAGTDPAAGVGDPPAQRGHLLTAAHAGHTLRVRLEDADPLRHRLGLTPAGPLAAAEVARWRDCLDGAWRILAARHPAAAATLAAVLRVVVPVRPDPAAEGISATSAEAYGAVALSAPADARSLAVGLLHEAQHSVLNATRTLFDLVRPGGPAQYSPWRDDPRPAFGVLHGAYAYLAVTRFWRAEATFAATPVAEFEYARWRSAVADAADRLLAGGELTAAGERLATALRAEVTPWLAEPVTPEVARLAELANADHRVRWRLRNLAVAPRDVAALAEAWRAGAEPPRVAATVVPASRRALENSRRLRLIQAVLKGESAGPPGGRGSSADDACVRGDLGAAADAYRKMIFQDAADEAAWAGLALATPVLRRRPELVRALHRTAPDADPADLAGWLMSSEAGPI